MVRPERSFTKTRSNNATEKEPVHFLLSQGRNFQRLPVSLKKQLLGLLGLEGEFSSRVFDLVYTERELPPLTPELLRVHHGELVLVEAKATKKRVKDKTLHGFFFGATANEYRAAQRLGSRYKFAFVVLNKDNAYGEHFYELLDHQELEARTRTKRVQFQVNLGPPKQL